MVTTSTRDIIILTTSSSSPDAVIVTSMVSDANSVMTSRAVTLTISTTSTVTNVASSISTDPTVSYSSISIAVSVTSTVAASSIISTMSATVVADTQSGNDSDDISFGIVIAAIIGVAFCVVLLVMIITLLRCYKKRKVAQDFPQVKGN